MLKRWRRRSSRGGVTAFVDEGSRIEGHYSFTGTAMLNGALQGEIVSDGTLVVGDTARIEASVEVGVLVLAGRLTGSVRAARRVELRPTARLVGEVTTPTFVIEPGAVFEGHCRMVQDPVEEPAARPGLTLVSG
jgi:cytoskeletal protein CcmA (bactofilin family)